MRQESLLILVAVGIDPYDFSHVAKPIFLSFEKAREFVQSLCLKSVKEWQHYAITDRPNNIPSNSDRIYKDKGWISWGDFLGTGMVSAKNKIFLSFKKAGIVARKLRLKSSNEWQNYVITDRPNNIPYSPNETYKDKGWVSWGDFLDTGNIRPQDMIFLSFKESRKLVRKLRLKSVGEWEEYRKNKPDNIPSNPNRKYKDSGWKGWGDFLGTDNIKNTDKIFLSFEEARKFSQSLCLKSVKEWQNYSKTDRPNNIPSAPNETYKENGWISWGDFLGTGNINSKDRIFLSFKKARKFVRKLGLKSKYGWNKYRKERPDNIPSDPDRVYKDEWKGWADFLGYKKNQK